MCRGELDQTPRPQDVRRHAVYSLSQFSQACASWLPVADGRSPKRVEPRGTMSSNAGGTCRGQSTSQFQL